MTLKPTPSATVGSGDTDQGEDTANPSTVPATSDETAGQDDAAGDGDTPAEDPATANDDPASQDDAATTDEDTIATDDDDSDDAPILTPAEVAKLSPEAKRAYAGIQKAATKKFQTLAALRKEAKASIALTNALKDPVQRRILLKQLAEADNITFTEPNAAATIDAVEAVIKDFAEQGANPEQLKILVPFIQRIANLGHDAALKPVKSQLDTMMAQNARTQQKATIEAFTAKYPDWEKYESKMDVLAKEILPAKDTPVFTYMERLYHLARPATAGVARAIKKMEAAAKISKPAVSTTVSGKNGRVVIPPKKGATIREMAEASKRGEVWEGE